MSRTANFSLMAPEVAEKASSLGLRIRIARQARRLRVADVAAKAGISRSTVEAIERGSLATSLGAYLAVLGCMNLAEELDLIADPGLDREGLALAYSVGDKRVRLPGKLNNDF